jgi:hypothetical protein
MEGILPEHFANLGLLLTEIRSCDEELFFNIEKLIEVIRLELEFHIIPELPRIVNQTYSWTDGLNLIFISVHAEEENQVECILEFHPHF